MTLGDNLNTKRVISEVTKQNKINENILDKDVVSRLVLVKLIAVIAVLFKWKLTFSPALQLSLQYKLAPALNSHFHNPLAVRSKRVTHLC